MKKTADAAGDSVEVDAVIADLREALLEADTKGREGGAPIGTKSKRKTGIWQKVKGGVWKLVKPKKGKSKDEPKGKSKKGKGEKPHHKWAGKSYKSPKKGRSPKVGELAPVLPGKAWKKVEHEPRSTMEKYVHGGKWTPERKQLHKSILDHFLSTTEPVPKDKQPVAVMLMGGPATGKGRLSSGIDEKKFVKVDADNIKEMIPEYQEMVAKGDRNAANYVHKESGELASRLRDIARKQRKNMVLDGTGRFAGSYMHRMGQLQDAGYHVQLMMPVVSDVEDAVDRAAKRAKESGRVVPEHFIRDNHKQVMRNFPRLADMADSAFLFDNNGKEPKLAWARHGDWQQTMDDDFVQDFMGKFGRREKRRRGRGKGEEEVYRLSRDLSSLVREQRKQPPAVDPKEMVKGLMRGIEPEPPKDERFGEDEGILVPEPDDAAI